MPDPSIRLLLTLADLPDGHHDDAEGRVQDGREDRLLQAPIDTDLLPFQQAGGEPVTRESRGSTP